MTSVEVIDEKRLRVTREIAGGSKEVSEIDLPCVLSIQTGINEPRYVGMRGIRQVASAEIPILSASDLDLTASLVGENAARVNRLDYFVPEAAKNATILSGEREEVAEKLIGLMTKRGGLQV